MHSATTASASVTADRLIRDSSLNRSFSESCQGFVILDFCFRTGYFVANGQQQNPGSVLLLWSVAGAALIVFLVRSQVPPSHSVLRILLSLRYHDFPHGLRLGARGLWLFPHEVYAWAEATDVIRPRLEIHHPPPTDIQQFRPVCRVLSTVYCA